MHKENAAAPAKGAGEGRIPFSTFWLIASLFISGLFIGILGPGINFPN